MDLRPLLRPRHLLVTLLVGILTGATIAAASLGTDRDVPASLSAPVAIPMPRVGDRALYDVWDDEDPNTDAAADRTLAFTWGEDKLRMDSRGDRVWSTPLHVQIQRAGQEPDNGTYNLRSGTMEIVSQGGDTVVLDSFSDPGGGLPPSPSKRWNNTVAYEWFTDEEFVFSSGYWGSLPCLRYPFQGGLLRLSPEPVDFGGCSTPLAHGHEAEYTVMAVGGEKGSRDVLIEGMSQGNFEIIPAPVVRLWMREGLPYPVRVEALSSLGQVYEVAVLREFAPGTAPLGGERPVDSSIPELILKPTTQVGPDDGGIDHPFPLSQAFAAARTGNEALAAFVKAHPDAYVGWAHGLEYKEADSRSYRWFFGVTDGIGQVGVDITRTFPVPTVEGVPDLNGLVVQPRDTYGEEPNQTVSGYPYVPMPRDQLPAELPSVQSLFEEWSAYAQEEDVALGANFWSFQIGAKVLDTAIVPGLVVEAGRVSYEEQGTPVDLDESMPRTLQFRSSRLIHHDNVSSVRIFAQGDLVAATNEVTLPAATPPATEEPAPAPATASTVLPARDWNDLTPLEKATIGIGAVGAALLWWFAPVIKGAVAPLFSRIRGDELLEHPARRLAHDLVGERPGIHHQELVRRLGKGKGGAEHHLRKMVAAGLLVRKESPGYTCYFLPGQASRAAVAAAPVTKSEVAQRILALRRLEPAITNAELARRLAVRPATIHYHVERLRAAGLLHDGPALDGAAQAA